MLISLSFTINETTEDGINAIPIENINAAINPDPKSFPFFSYCVLTKGLFLTVIVTV